MLDIYLKPEEIQKAIDDSYGWDVVEIIPTEAGIRQRELSLHMAVAKASADNAVKKIVEAFEGAGIYEINQDGVYFWNPQKFREFWEEIKKLTQ